MRHTLSGILCALLLTGCGAKERREANRDLRFPGERHLRNVRQLTFGGQNAEAYFSPDGRKLILQSTVGDYPCDRIFTMDIDGGNFRLVSTGTGRTTCGYFVPRTERIIYSSTHEAGPECPPPPDHSHGYVWSVYEAYEIYSAKRDGSDLRRLTYSPGYDAEGTLSADGSRIVFTSKRDDDLDIYVMNVDGSEVRRLTYRRGYDGGPFFSADGSEIVYRAHYPEKPEEIAEYDSLLALNLVRPHTLDIYVMNADGTNKRRVTDNGAANFAPFFHPDGRRIIYASNVHDPGGRNFDLYLIEVDGAGLERVTTNETFDGFPMFSPDGRHLVFASNRFNSVPGETNIFIAEWVE